MQQLKHQPSIPIGACPLFMQITNNWVSDASTLGGAPNKSRNRNFRPVAAMDVITGEIAHYTSAFDLAGTMGYDIDKVRYHIRTGKLVDKRWRLYRE